MSSHLSLGIRQNASNPNKNHDSGIIVGAVFLALSTLGLIARMVSHAMRHKNAKLDDYLLFWSCAICVGEIAMLIWVKSQSLTQMKTWYVSITLGAALICLPIKSLWDPAVPGHCGNQYLFDRIVPVPWIVTDFAILVAPLPVIRNLNMSMRSKIIVVALILIGCLTCIVSCVRYSKTFWAIEDPTWNTVGLADWQLIEANVTILCVCLVASKPVADYLVPDGLVRMGSYISRSLRSHRSMEEANEDPPLKDRLRGLSHHRNEDGIELQQHNSLNRSEDMVHSCV